MLNMNSPTVQAMLNNTPQGFGNMPGYYGSSPTVITTQTVAQPQQQQPQGMPFPSPKEMLMQGGQQMIYQPTTFAPPRNIVGGYNPGYQAAFGDYYNPYMGYGYSGYGYGFNNPLYMQPMDDDARERLEAANYNNSTYDEQLDDDEKLFKSISRIVSKNVSRTEEEAAECEKRFDRYDKYARSQPVYNKKPMRFLSVSVTRGDEVLAAMEAVDVDVYKREDYKRCCYQAEYMKTRNAINEANMIHYRNQLYERAPERAFDNMDLLDFLNNGAGVVLAHDMSREIYEQGLKRTAQAYNKDTFRENLLKKNGIRTRAQRSAVERFAGRYGVMPDGRPVSPGHDPAVASSFSYDPNTGQYSVTAPNFMRDRLELARQSFIRSLDEP